jgi:anti-sigma B factor antagonist
VPEAVEPFLGVTVSPGTGVDVGSFIVVIDGEIEFATAPKLRATLVDLAQADGAAVVLDLRDVSFLDSAGISLLIQAKKRLANGGGTLALRAPRPNVRRVLEMSGVDELFVIQD